MQRSSDWLRTGNFSDPAETGLTSDLQKLGQQVKDAARALGNTEHTSEEASLNRAMDDLSRLRDQLGSLGGRPSSQPGQGQGQPGRSGQPGSQQFQSGSLARNGQPGQQGQAGGQQGQQGGQNAGGGQAGQVGDRLAGPAGNPAGGLGLGARSLTYGYGSQGRAGTPQTGPNPADTQRQIDQGLNLLNQVRAVVQDTPEARQQLQSLIDQMRGLDPSRFPGNPGLVEQMHQQLVSGVDALELQLRRRLEESQGGTIRNTDPSKIPAGYQDSVAEYYRKLSSTGH
jgi:hypothetical protein